MSGDTTAFGDEGRAESFEETTDGQSSPRGRFQPGRSGNPKGRPRKRHKEQSAIDAALEEQVTIKDRNGTRKISAANAIAKRLVQKAVAGDISATKLLQRESPDFLKRIEQAAGLQAGMAAFMRHMADCMSEQSLMEFRNGLSTWEQKMRRART